MSGRQELISEVKSLYDLRSKVKSEGEKVNKNSEFLGLFEKYEKSHDEIRKLLGKYKGDHKVYKTEDLGNLVISLVNVEAMYDEFGKLARDSNLTDESKGVSNDVYRVIAGTKKDLYKALKEIAPKRHKEIRDAYKEQAEKTDSTYKLIDKTLDRLLKK